MNFASIMENIMPTMAFGRHLRAGSGSSGIRTIAGFAGSSSSSSANTAPVSRKEDPIAWMQDIEKGARSPSRVHLNQLILDYLITQGHAEAAATFQREAALSADLEESDLPTRVDIRTAVQNGRIKEAIHLVNSAYPELLDFNPRLYFHLRQQELIELIREARLEDALDFAQTHLSGLIEGHPELLPELEEVMALLAFEKPEESSFGRWLSLGQRDKLACELNAAILDSIGSQSSTKLDFMLKVLLWAQDRLNSSRVIYPELTDLAEGKFKSE